MDRRKATGVIAAGMSLLQPSVRAFGAGQCGMSPVGPVCSSFIPAGRLVANYTTQQMPEWCWAASISMIFAYNGHPVSQPRIVSEAYGSIANIPGNYPAMFGSLNRSWTDDNGGDFTVSVTNLFAPELNSISLNNADLAQTLQNEQPILYCTAQHAMVLTAMSYRGAAVIEAWVMDPWPGNGLRRLSPIEMTPFPLGGSLRMAATLDIT